MARPHRMSLDHDELWLVVGWCHRVTPNLLIKTIKPQLTGRFPSQSHNFVIGWPPIQKQALAAWVLNTVQLQKHKIFAAEVSVLVIGVLLETTWVVFDDRFDSLLNPGSGGQYEAGERGSVEAVVYWILVRYGMILPSLSLTISHQHKLRIYFFFETTLLLFFDTLLTAMNHDQQSWNTVNYH